MITIFVLLLLVVIVMSSARFFLGPSDVDRIIAFDIMFSAAIAMCVAAALQTERVLFLDIAIGVALVGFVATLAWSRLVERRSAVLPSSGEMKS